MRSLGTRRLWQSPPRRGFADLLAGRQPTPPLRRCRPAAADGEERRCSEGASADAKHSQPSLRASCGSASHWLGQELPARRQQAL